MACSSFRVFVIFCFALFQVTKSQTDAVCAALNCSLSMYILIGIAALYAVFSIICIALIIIACNCKRRNRVQHKSPNKKVRSNAHSKQRLVKLDDFYAANADDLGEVTTTTDLNLEIFENPHAKEHESENEHSFSSSSEEEDKQSSDNSDNENVIIKNPSASSKRHEHLTQNMTRGSPLTYHQPKGSPIPPAKVRVPFAEPDVESSPRKNKRLPPLITTSPRQRMKVAAAAVNRSGQSPFSRRNNPLADIPKDTKKSTPKINRVQQLKTSPRKEEDSEHIPESVLKFEMVQISHKWFEVGRAFQLPSSFLSNTNIICDDNDKCMIRVCMEWLKSGQRDWAELIDVLNSEQIDEKRLAKRLKSTYLKIDGSEDSLVGNGSEGSLSWYFNHGSQNDAPVHGSTVTQKEEEADDPAISWID